MDVGGTSRHQLLYCFIAPKSTSSTRPKYSAAGRVVMLLYVQNGPCDERSFAGQSLPLEPVNPERSREMVPHPGYSKNAAIEAIRRHAFNYLPRDITDDPEGPVTKSIRLTSCLILRNLARYSGDGRRLLRRHERLLSWLSLSRLESSSALAQLLAELYCQPPSASPL
ncbi:unnamed protein product [Gongylonema pulchrum]|uniref:DUF4817 domain-containing protein n=1 Tax=Gongylonema pulchrum TaxID=637853 RepID=A0A183D045_9BILA|nr:unnamed protein product [Gongylonema pulchrum]